MGLMKEAHKKAQEEHKIARSAQAKANHEQMTALAKIQPSPTIEAVQRAMGIGVVRKPKEQAAPEVKTEPPVVEVEKVSEPVHSSDAGTYKTRASKKDDNQK